MASEKPESTSFRGYIEAKIAKWHAVLAAYNAAQEAEGTEIGMLTPTASIEAGRPIDLPKGAFLGKSVPACVELYLASGMVKRTNREIAEALKRGGVESNAKNFDSVVTGALFGLKREGKVLRFDDGWGLAEWYPAHIRAATPAANGMPRKKTRKTKKSKKAIQIAPRPVTKPAIKADAASVQAAAPSKLGAIPNA